MCSYHGWRWQGDGNVTAVPAATSTELERIKDNPKSNCNAFPTKVKEGVLWVWPSSGSDARILSELTPVPDMSLDGMVDVDPSREVVYGPWMHRYLPYGWDFFVENIIGKRCLFCMLCRSSFLMAFSSIIYSLSTLSLDPAHVRSFVEGIEL